MMKLFVVVLLVLFSSSTAINSWLVTCPGPSDDYLIDKIEIKRQDESQPKALFDGFLVQRIHDIREESKTDIYTATVYCWNKKEKRKTWFMFDFEYRGKE